MFKYPRPTQTHTILAISLTRLLFLKRLGDKFSHKRIPNIWKVFGLILKTFGTIGLLFNLPSDRTASNEPSTYASL